MPAHHSLALIVCWQPGVSKCDSIRDLIFLYTLFLVMLQPSEVTKNDSTTHKMMVQFFFPPAGEIRLEEVVSRELD